MREWKGEIMRRRLIEWLIRVLLPHHHLHKDPVRKPKGEDESSGIDVSYPWPDKAIEPVEV